MIEQQGRVIGVDGQYAAVHLGGSSGCSACDEGKGCGAGIFGRLLNRGPVTLTVPNTAGALSGQAVMLGIPESLLLMLVLRLYALPLAGLLLGACIGFFAAHLMGFDGLKADLITLTFSIIGAAGAMTGVRRWRIELSEPIDVHMIRVVNLNGQNLIERTICE